MYAGGAPSTSIATTAPISISNARAAGPSMRTIRDRDEEAGSDGSTSDASGESSSEAGEDDVQNYARSLTYQVRAPCRFLLSSLAQAGSSVGSLLLLCSDLRLLPLPPHCSQPMMPARKTGGFH
jgi:hypothetical protein